MAVTASRSFPVQPSSDLAKKIWERLRRRKAGLFALIMILLQIVLALVAPLIMPHDPLKGDYASVLQSPSGQYLLGTDDLGRDVLSRLILGSRVSIAVGIFSQLTIVLIGIPLGALSGLMGGWVDYLIMRIIDVLSSLPSLLLYILLMIVLGAGMWNIILAMSLTGWIGIARLVRGQVLSLKATDYVRAARAMGGTTWWVITRHLLRNSMSPVIVALTLGVPGAMFAEAGLSLLGLGIAPPTPSWGQMIGDGTRYFRTNWYLITFPSLMLTFTILFWMMLGEALQEALDPRGS
ncbi:MAG: ABC transporter permease [Caldilineaceae bacterium]